MPVGSETRRIAGATPVLVVAAVALAHVAALLAVPPMPSLGSVVLLEGVVLGTVAVLTAVGDGGRPALVVTVVPAVCLALTWGLLGVGSSLLAVTLGVVTGLVLVGYGVHRYERVALGLVEGIDE